MTAASLSPQSDNPTAAGVNSSGPFNESAQNGVSCSTICKLLSDATLMLANAEGDLSIADIKKLKEHVKALEGLANARSVTPYYQHMQNRLAGLSHPDAPTFGRDLVSAIKNVGCEITVDKESDSIASYVSYSYAKRNRGFPNEVTLNPERASDEDKFMSSVVHEFGHALEKHAAPALHLSPFNPDTRVLIHPDDWILLEGACERHAFTWQGFTNLFASKDSPSILERTKYDIVTPAEAEAALKKYGTLADAMVHVALNCLSKTVREGDVDGPTFVNNYQGIAVNNFFDGMAMRAKEKETGIVYVRLELPDLWRVGDCGVGPNVFGKSVMEPLFMKRHPLLPDTERKLTSGKKTYGIPPLEKCQSIREYMQDQAQLRAQTGQIPASNSFANSVLATPAAFIKEFLSLPTPSARMLPGHHIS